MACFHPKVGWLPLADYGDGLRPVFRRPVVGRDYQQIELPCKRCQGCRLDIARDWGIRAAHEAYMHEWNCFITLTYDQEHLPFRGMLKKKDFNQFIVDLRNAYRKDDPIRYLGVGEYGSKYWRPHYHACLFGKWFFDAKPAGKSRAGFQNYESAELTALWGKGRAVINAMCPEIAEYAARYSLKKVGETDGYSRVDPRTGDDYLLPPEFMAVSRMPGIGRSWLEKFALDVFPHDYVISRKGTKVPTPRYYLRVLREWCEEDYQSLKEKRVESASGNLERFRNSMPDRLAVREIVLSERLKFSVRSVE